MRRYDVIPWEAIKYMISSIVFGGRLIDELDRRVLNCYINDLFNVEAVNEPNYPLSKECGEEYFIPPHGSL